eukprot:m.828260 g.828260  ORF g.828260 m.828260 type:complete len:741 (+) comp59436_c0_seq2:266-2488(+)
MTARLARRPQVALPVSQLVLNASTDKFLSLHESRLHVFLREQAQLQALSSVPARSISGVPRVSLSQAGNVAVVFSQDGLLLVHDVTQLAPGVNPLVKFAHAHYKGGISSALVTDKGKLVINFGGDKVIQAFQYTAVSSDVVADETTVTSSAAQAFVPPPLRAFARQYTLEPHAAAASSVDGKPVPATAAAFQAQPSLPEQAELTAKVSDLRSRLMTMIEANESKPGKERLAREEYVLDVAERDRMAAAADQELEQIRESIQFEILEQQFLHDAIKKECWDSMETPGKTLYSFKTNLEVSNFPIRKRSERELKEISRIRLLRKIEMNEARILNEVFPASKSQRPSLFEDFSDRNQRVLGESEPGKTGQQAKGAPAVAGAHAAAGTEAGTKDDEEHKTEHKTAAPAAVARTETAVREEDEEDSQSAQLYDPMLLTSTIRKRHQLLLLQDTIHTLKLKFNAELDEAHHYKKDETAKIAERNARIKKILGELNMSEELAVVQKYVLETPDELLTVKDEEVLVERVYTVKEKAAREEAARKEAERLLAEQADNVRERGVLEMMNNRLESRTEEDIWLDPPRPDFLTALAPDNWNDDHKRLAAEYTKQMQELADLRDKRRKALEAERIKLYEQIATSCDTFDARLKALFQSRIAVEQTINQIEVNMTHMAVSLQYEQDAIVEETKARLDIETHRLLKTKAANIVAQAKEGCSCCCGGCEQDPGRVRNPRSGGQESRAHLQESKGLC